MCNGSQGVVEWCFNSYKVNTAQDDINEVKNMHIASQARPAKQHGLGQDLATT